MNSIYIHYVDWPNTKGNHAGMAYLSKYLQTNLDSIKIKEFKTFSFRGAKYFNYLRALVHSLYFLIKLKNGDTIYFMQYMSKGSSYQEVTGLIISKVRPDIVLMGMVHLTGNGLLKRYVKNDNLRTYLNALSKIWVLGSSLKTFMIELGIDHSKILQTFHYVDTEYYKPGVLKKENTFNILIQGNQLRDYKLLSKIIIQCPDINFTIMQGIKDLSHLFSKFKNVKLIGFVSEKELLSIMQNSDVSLSVMEDTIGSNVITTSMACGLVMIVSNVGSIMDYCDKENAFFCHTIEDYVNALHYLNGNRDICEIMRLKSRTKALDFNKEKFLYLFQKEINNCNALTFK